ncbi:MAG TPA: hypothetical protein VKV80_14375 [Streptosporangiaceae bacterium]|nr:hypothetical protein [Streptosporangiaceae bacterium]
MTSGRARVEQAHVDQARKVADAILYEGYLLYPYRASARKNQSRFQFGVLMPPAYRAVDDSEAPACQTECLAECGDEARVEISLRFLRLQRRTVYAAGPFAPSAGSSPPAPAEGTGSSPATSSVPSAGPARSFPPASSAPGNGELREVSSLVVDGEEFTSWDEAREEEQRFSVNVASLLGSGTERAFHLPGGETAEDLRDADGHLAGRLVRRWSPVDGTIDVHAERVAGPYQALKLRVRVENRSRPDTPPRTRDDGLRHALIAAHTLIGVAGGTFLSMTDPPEWAAAEIAACVNTGTWPVLAGPAECRNLMLSSPVILYDHPEIAPESAGDLYDATEIDEILTLRTLALTDAEKQEARSTDPRAADLIDRLDDLPPEMLERMHGAIRYLAPARSHRDRTPAPPGGVPTWSEPCTQDSRVPRGAAAGPSAPFSAAGPAGSAAGTPWGPGAAPPSVPWWDPGADTSVSPETDHVIVGGVPVARGSRVRMRPGSRRADAQDLFLAGREAVVEAVLHDVDGHVHVAVSPVSDPAAELQRSHGRFLYFAPDELEPAGAVPAEGGNEPGGHDDPRGQKEEGTR